MFHPWIVELLYFTLLITGLWAITYKSTGMLWIILIIATVQPMAGFWNMVNFIFCDTKFGGLHRSKKVSANSHVSQIIPKEKGVQNKHIIHRSIRRFAGKHLKCGNSLARFPSRCFYDGTLTNGPGTLLREKIDGCGAQDGPWGPKVGCCCWWVAVCWQLPGLECLEMIVRDAFLLYFKTEMLWIKRYLWWGLYKVIFTRLIHDPT